MVIPAVAAAAAIGLALVSTAPAAASGGWGFGMSVSPGVLASCTDYNLIPARVDMPDKAYAGYITGLLTNTRTGTARWPIWSPQQLYNVGSVTTGILVFNPPRGTQSGDILHVLMKLSYSPTMYPVVGSFEFDYRCDTGEIIHPAQISAPINASYGDKNVSLANDVDAQGNPDVQIWCNDPQGATLFKNFAITKALLANYPAKPSANTLIEKNNSCLVTVSAWVLTSGEVMVSIGPNAEGVVDQVFFTGLPPSNVHFFKYNVNQGIGVP